MALGNTIQGEKLKLEAEQAASIFEKLPLELSLEIISRLPFLSLTRFMCTSRFCSQFSQVPSLFTQFENDDPLLIFSTKDSTATGDVYFVEFTEEKEAVSRTIRTPFNNMNMIRASCNGMLCLSDYWGTEYIYNPFTKQCKELPESSSGFGLFLGFGFHPVANEYKIIRMLESCRQRQSAEYNICVHTIGVNERITLMAAPPLLLPEPSQAVVNGRLHWKIIAFDLLDERFIDIPIPAHGIDERHFCLDVAVLGGSLSGVFSSISRNGRSNQSFEIWVMKEYEVPDSWTHILRVDQWNLFVGTLLCSQLELKKVVCLLKNEKVLVLYTSGVLVCHDLNGGLNAELVFMKPNMLQAFAHVASRNWVE